MTKKIHVAVTVDGEGTNVSFSLGEATVGQLALINAELDNLKKEVLDSIRDIPKDYEIEDFGEEEP